MRALGTDTRGLILRGYQALIRRRTAIVEDIVTTWITAAEPYPCAAESSTRGRNRVQSQSFLATSPVLGPDESSVQAFGEATA